MNQFISGEHVMVQRNISADILAGNVSIRSSSIDPSQQHQNPSSNAELHVPDNSESEGEVYNSEDYTQSMHGQQAHVMIIDALPEEMRFSIEQVNSANFI